MAANKTSLSAGEIIRTVLTSDETVMGIVTKVFPVATDEAKLPYVMYRRAHMEQVPTKGIGADTVGIEVTCYAEQYTQSVELAEAVRAALDGKQASIDGLSMRSCHLTDSEEAWEDDAYVQQLIFTIKI
jgi:hypothetical protein